MAKQPYWDLLDALQEHPTFATCETRGCRRCKEIQRLGKIAYILEIDQFDLPKDFSDFTPEIYEELRESSIKDIEIYRHYGMQQRKFIDWKNKNKIQGRRSKIPLEVKLKIFDLEAQGYTHKHMSALTGVDSGTISNILCKQRHILDLKKEGAI